MTVSRRVVSLDRRVLGAAFHVQGVVIDLPEIRLALDLEVSEVVLTVRVIVLREIAEGLNRQEYAALVLIGRPLTPAVITTWPPMKVLRKLSLSTRMRSEFSEVCFRSTSNNGITVAGL